MAQQFQITSAVLSDKGRKRDNNEDYALFFEPGDNSVKAKSGNLYIVADGVGGEARGEFASRFSAEKVLYEYYAREKESPAERLHQGMELANKEIQDYTRNTQSAKMATTLVAAVVLGDKLTIANIGDSRAYLYHNGQLEQISRDHNLVGEMVASGLMTEEEGERSDVKNRLLRSVGGHPEFKPEFFTDILLEPGDRILLCSDGVTRYARKETIEEYLKLEDIDEVVKKLVSFAYQSGGADNITALAVEIGPQSGDSQVQRGTFPRAVSLKNLIQQDMQDTQGANEPPETQEILIGTKDRTLEVAVPQPTMEKTQETATPRNDSQSTQPSEPNGVAKTLPAIKPATPVTNATKPGTPPFRPTSGPSPSSSRLWILVILLACLFLIAVTAAVLLLFGDKLLNRNGKATSSAVSTSQVSESQTFQIQTMTETIVLPTETVVFTETPAVEQSAETSDEQTGEIGGTSEVTGSTQGNCLIVPQSGQGLSTLFGQFEVPYDPNETYQYYDDCLVQDGRLGCGKVIDLPPAEHGMIQLTWWIVIPEVTQEQCEAKDGTWY